MSIALPLRQLLPALLCLLPALSGHSPVVASESSRVLAVSGTRFTLDGTPFPYVGLSFFNALYNPTFHRDQRTRQAWLEKFKANGITVLRVWCQWDNGSAFADVAESNTLYAADGTLRESPLAALTALLSDANRLGMCLEITLFSQESYLHGRVLAPPVDEQAVEALTTALAPYRNASFQIWNEHSDARVLHLLQRIRQRDPQRLLTNAPGYAGDLGSDAENLALDYLTPHTSRTGRPWERAPQEIASLIARFGKPVVDDEPARNGTASNGGPQGPTSPFDHILHIHGVWQVGGWPTYHHDLFQTGYGSPAVPPSGIPDPEFNPYHRAVFAFLAQRERFLPALAP